MRKPPSYRGGPTLHRPPEAAPPSTALHPPSATGRRLLYHPPASRGCTAGRKLRPRDGSALGPPSGSTQGACTHGACCGRRGGRGPVSAEAPGRCCDGRRARVEVLERLGDVDVEDEDAAVGAAVEGDAQALEALLTRRVPDLPGGRQSLASEPGVVPAGRHGRGSRHQQGAAWWRGAVLRRCRAAAAALRRRGGVPPASSRACRRP